MALNKHAKAWIAALRSGRYKQGKHYLTKQAKGETRHCCLGVACQLFIKAGGKLKTGKFTDNGYVITTYGDKGEHMSLPPIVKDWLGLKGTSGQFRESGEFFSGSLAERNDAGVTFKKIADLIVEHKESLFRKRA